MAESSRDEHVSHEKGHIQAGIIEVEYDDGETTVLQTAEVRSAWTKFHDKKLHYDILVNSKDYELEPYTVYEDETLLTFGNSLEETFSEEGKFALHSKRHVLDLGFLAVVSSQPGRRYLENDIALRFWEDSNDIPLDLSILVEDEGYDLWVRLERRQQFRSVPLETIIARLAFIGTGEEDKVTMVPYIKSHDSSQTVQIPQQLTFGHPWLYVGVNYNDVS
ncbi:MAG: hypothetical protein JWN12_41 [Candidatus Saccharibacteria bacterium]|nr:hypothetical protein [Candidatus Saccharibacteria bacterium]